jgi:hypothetical protein
MNWREFKEISEREFKFIELAGNIYGPQIQPGTKWNSGLRDNEIVYLEVKFGFEFPETYRNFLATMNGFDTEQICIDPEGEEPESYMQRCYEYPKDHGSQASLLNDLKGYQKVALGALEDRKYDTSEIEGFVPLFGHLALAVFNDKCLSPVVSVWGDDIVVLGMSLLEYWILELGLEDFF